MRHLDSNLVIAILRGDERLRRKLDKHRRAIANRGPVLAELRHGALKSGKPAANLALLDRLLGYLPIVPFDASAANRYAQNRLDLERVGWRIGEIDMLIAAKAMSHQVTLVTHDTAHFNRIRGLELEDWQAEA